MGIYESLGVRTVINADSRLTRLGGSLMPEPVLQAMAEAAGNYVDMHELQLRVGQRIAQLTHNEAAYVSTGAATGLFLAALACMAGSDEQLLKDWPNLPKREIIIQKAQRIPYDLAVRQAGAQLVEIHGDEQPLEVVLSEAINSQTAAVLFIAGEHLSKGALPLPTVIEIAHARNVPVIVDAAAQLPPPENLWRYTRDLGADLAIFSGGKDLGGPQPTGLIVGREELIAACRANGAPNQRLGRPMKVGKEEMLGLLAAVELYLSQDHAARVAEYERIVQYWIDNLGHLPGVLAERVFPNEAGQATPRLRLTLDPALAGMSGAELRQQLWDQSPRVAVQACGTTGVYATPDTLAPNEETIIVERIQAVLRH